MGRRKITIEEFIRRAREVHGDKYDYSKVVYVDNKTKVCIICPIHGEFWQTPHAHLSGQGCRKCGYIDNHINATKTTLSFIKEARAVHGDLYDYSLVDYKNNKTDVRIICPIHGEFLQNPSAHLKGCGCPKCGSIRSGNSKRLNADDFIIKSVLIHGNIYDYTRVDYKGYHTEVCIACPIHGEFWQTPADHLRGYGCPVCGKISRSKRLQLSWDEVLVKFRKMHRDRYNYDNSDYQGSHVKIDIICPMHGTFRQMPYTHWNGCGCPKCKSSWGERRIMAWLEDKDIEYMHQYNIRPPQVLFSRNVLKVDFYIPDYSIIIEFNGQQHYERVERFHPKEEDFVKQQLRDRRVREYCKQHKIRLIEIPYTEIDNIDKILKRYIK